MPEKQKSDPLHMVQLSLDSKRLVGLGRMLKLPLRRIDTPYLVHCALGELFGDQSPKPFSLEDAPWRLNGNNRGRQLRILGYTDVELDELETIARGYASPVVYEICDWDRSASKPMPDSFPKNMVLRFELRACPVVRKSSDGPKWTSGQELDVFLSEAWEDPDKELDREDVYCDWLKNQLETRGGARLQKGGLKRFSIRRMTRRVSQNGKEQRKAVTLQRPDVTLEGALEVTGPDAFYQLLQRGIGRHKSFGFGMLKVRRT